MLACLWMPANQFFSNLLWFLTQLNKVYSMSQFETSQPSFKVTWLWKSQNLCNHAILKLHEVIQMFKTVDYVREMTDKSVWIVLAFPHLCGLFFFFTLTVSLLPSTLQLIFLNDIWLLLNLSQSLTKLQSCCFYL